MRTSCFTRLALGLAATMVVAGPADAHATGYTGKYTNGFNRYPNISLVMQQTGAHVRGVLTIVGNTDATEVVTSEFDGRVIRGVVYFNWTDNFENSGTASFQAASKGFVLSSRITRPANDGRYFEGRFGMTRTSSHVEAGEVPPR